MSETERPEVPSPHHPLRLPRRDDSPRGPNLRMLPQLAEFPGPGGRGADCADRVGFHPAGAGSPRRMLFKSRRVEEFFEYVGLHDALSTIYTPVAMWFFSLTGMRP